MSLQPRQFAPALLLLLLALAGCGPRIHYDYTPPQSPEGRLCASECNHSRQLCWSGAHQSYQQCLTQRNWAMQNYNQCRDNATSREARNRCFMPPACYYPSTGYCDEGYRACYQACGGTVRAVQEPES